MPAETYYWQLQENTDHWQLEDGTGNWLIEEATNETRQFTTLGVGD